MKKLSILIATIAVIAMSSCTAQSPKANLKTDVDSLSYAIGMARTQGLVPYLTQMGIDSTQMGEFLKGLTEGASIDKNDKKKNAHLIGMQIGQQISGQWISGLNQEIFGADSTQTISKESFLAGFIAATMHKDMKMSEDSARMYAETRMQAIKEKAMEKLYSANKQEGAAFLEKNKSQEGVVTLPSGLQYKVITEGKGAIPTTSDRVKVNYRGTLIDGTEFDSSYSRNMPAEFGTTQVIKGWTEALTLMPVGSKWMLYIPQELAYGGADQGQIKPFSTLIFEVELLEILK